MEDDLQCWLAAVPGLAGQSLVVTPLAGGLTNRNFLVTAAGQAVVARVAGPGTELLGIDRVRELACARLAAAAGVGPALIAHLPEHELTVYEYLSGEVLTEATARQPARLRRIGALLRRYHALPAPVDLGRFCPFATIRHYAALAQQRGATLPVRLGAALTLLSEIEQAVATREPPCLCHNDLLAGNFIDDGRRVCIIDWEYGGLGERFFDLGNFAVNQGLTAAQELELLAAYFGVARRDDLRRLRLMRLVSDLREALWGVVQSAISKLHPPAYYQEYGQKHLDRFLAAAQALNLPQAAG